MCDGDSVFAVHTLWLACDHTDAWRFPDQILDCDPFRKNMTTASSHVRWFLIFWLFMLSAVAFLDRVNISIAGSSLAAAYHLSNVQLGWVFSAFLAGYALFQTPGGRLVD